MKSGAEAWLIARECIKIYIPAVSKNSSSFSAAPVGSLRNILEAKGRAIFSVTVLSMCVALQRSRQALRSCISTAHLRERVQSLHARYRPPCTQGLHTWHCVARLGGDDFRHEMRMSCPPPKTKAQSLPLRNAPVQRFNCISVLFRFWSRVLWSAAASASRLIICTSAPPTPLVCRLAVWGARARAKMRVYEALRKYMGKV